MPKVSVPHAIQTLKSGGIVAIPTETVYGLAGSVDFESALKSIFKVKERPFFDPLIVHVTDWKQATTFFEPTHGLYEKLAKAFWPGPLTLVAPRRERVNDLITSGLATVAVRCPRHPIALEILNATGALAAPSANRFGKTSPTSAAHVAQEFPDQVEIVDGGECEIGLESTVITIQDGALEILRPGRVLFSQLKEWSDEYGLTIRTTSSVSAPGHLKHHYQPDVPLVLLKTSLSDSEIEKKLQSRLSKKFNIKRLSLPQDVREAARRLYGEMRKAASNANNVIVVDPNQYGWTMDASDLRDRLDRAASYIF